MIQSEHRDRVASQMPAEKWAGKKVRAIQGIVTAAFGAVLCLGALGLAFVIAAKGGELGKWPVALMALLFLSGLLMVSQGAHNVSSELTRAAWRDIASTINAVWKRGKEG